jgi:AcrR family transcriptional regulator
MPRQAVRNAELRARQIDAAECGFEAVKARDLAAEAECAIGAIYNVLEDLDELVLCVGSGTLAMLDAALGAVRSRDPYGSTEEAIADLVRLALAYFDFAARHQVRWRALFEHRIAEAHSLPDWHVEQHQVLFAQVEAPLATLLPGLDDDRRRILARALFSAVHGMVALGLEEKLVSLPLSDLRQQVAAIVRAIAEGRNDLRNNASVRCRSGPINNVYGLLNHEFLSYHSLISV